MQSTQKNIKNSNLLININKLNVFFKPHLEFNIDENTNQSIINLTCASNFADFDLTLGRSTNETSQQRFFSGDRGFQYAGVTVREIRWGRA